MGDEAGPPEREVTTLRFQQLCRLRVFDNPPQSLTPPERLHLVAVSNKYGYTFVGSDTGVKILQTAELGRLQETTKETTGAVVADFDCIKVVLGSRPVHIALNNQDLILSVCYRTGNQLKLHLYDVRTVTKKGLTPAAFIAAIISTNPDIHLMNLIWNPGFEFLMAMCLSDGSCALWDSSGDSLKPLASLPPDVGATAVCWSPKGKQFVIGTAEGELKQFTHSTEQKKFIKPPDFTQEPVKVVDIQWISTFMFIVAYIDAEESLQPNVAVVHAAKEKPVSYINFEDICYGGCEERIAYYYMHNIDKWGFVIACSSNSVEGAVLGRQQANRDLWEIWRLEDAARVEMPLCDHEETMPLGMALDYTSQNNIKTTIHSLPPAPILIVLSSEGLLCPFYVVNTEEMEGITKKAVPLPTTGERVSTGSKPQATTAFGQPAMTSSASITGMTQPITQPPSSTPQVQVDKTKSAFAAGAGGLFSFGGLGSATNPPSSFPFKPPMTSAMSTSATTTTAQAAFSSKPSSSFGSPGFSFKAPQPPPGVPTSQGITTPHPQGSSATGFSFSAAGQSLAPTQPAAGFSFKVAAAPSQSDETDAKAGPPATPSAAMATGLFGSKPTFGSAPATAAVTSGLPSASATNSFISLSRPVTTMASTALPSAPGQQPAVARGPPNAVAPGPASTIARGPPNAVALGLPTAVVRGPPNAVAPGLARTVARGPPNAVARELPTAVARGPPNAVAPRSPSTVASGLPNAIAPSAAHTVPAHRAAGEPQLPQAVLKTPVSKPVEALQQTPKATPSGIASAGISASSTPMRASAKPVTAALLSNIQEEMNHFTKELNELKARASTGEHMVGSTSQLKSIHTGVDDLASFKVEVLECTKSLNEDVHGLKTKLLNSFALVEESRILKQRSEDPRYLQLLKSRGLDPQTARQMQEIHDLTHYLETGLRDTNACLDAEWEKLSYHKGQGQPRKLITPTMDVIYQTMSNHINVMTAQRRKLHDLRQRLPKGPRYDVPSTSSTIKPRDETSSLAARFAEVRVKPSPRAKSTPISARKQAVLRNFLSQRQTTLVRAAPRATVPSSPTLSSPSDLDDFPLPAEHLRCLSEDSPPDNTSQTDHSGRRPPHHAAVEDLRDIPPAAVLSSQPEQRKPQPVLPRDQAAALSAPRVPLAVAAPVPRGTEAGSRLIQAQVAPPKTSSFTHTGSGTVAWGMKGDSSKVHATSPCQLAGAAAMSRATGTKASNTPVEKPNPPVVNIKNLDTMRSTMPPPVTFAPVASTVDAGTAKVVTQVIAEMAIASGVKLPQPGTPASASPELLPTSPMSPTERPSVTTTQSISALVMTTASIHPGTGSGSKAPTSVKPTSQPAGLIAAPSDENSESGSEGKPRGFVFSPKVTNAPFTAPSVATANNAGFTFGLRTSVSPTSSATSTPAILAGMTSQPSTSGNSAGVKPQIFDFSGATRKPNASTGTPGGYFFGAAASSSTSTCTPSTTLLSVPQPAPPSQPASIDATLSSQSTSSGLGSLVKGKEGAASSGLPGGEDDSGTGKPTAAIKSPVDEAGTGASTKPSTALGSSRILGAMLDAPVATSVPSRPSDSGVEIAKQQQLTKGILTSSVGSTQAGSSSSAGSSARNLFGTAPSTATTTSATAATASTGLFTSDSKSVSASELFTLSKNNADVPETAPSTNPSAPQVTLPTTTVASESSFRKPAVSGSPFATRQTTSSTTGTSSSVTMTTASIASSVGIFGQPTSSATPLSTHSSSIFGQATTTTTTIITTAASTASGLSFDQLSTSTPSIFGQPGSSASSQGSRGFTFGGTSTLGPEGVKGVGVFGSSSNTSPIFGGSQSANPSFGQLANSAGPPSASNTGGPFGGSSSGGGGGGGFFSGLGKKPDPEAAKTNPFGVPSPTTPTGGFGSPVASGNNIFGSQVPKAFGSPPSSQAAAGFGGNAFDRGSRTGVGSAGFGGFGQANQGFGGVSAFGTGATFSNPLGQQSPFGNPPQSSSSGPFGASTPASNPSGGFGSFASQESPSFGALASNSPPKPAGFTQQQPSGFGAFGGGNNTGHGFGGFGTSSGAGFSSNASSGFSGGSSFSQYRS